MTGLSVRVSGIVFRGFADRDEYGFWIGKGGWEGWETAPAARADVVARANAHGTTDGPQFLDAREVVQTGFFRGRDEYELARMSRQISGLLADGTSSKLVVKTADETAYAKVRRGLNRPDVETLSDGELHVGEYQITYRCPDPRIYGETRVAPETGTATSVSVGHYGNFPAFSIVEIPSAPAAYTVTSPFGVFTVTGAVSGGTHRIDLRTGLVTRNGVLMSGVGRGALWSTPPWSATTWTLSVAGRVLTPDTSV